MYTLAVAIGGWHAGLYSTTWPLQGASGQGLVGEARRGYPRGVRLPDPGGWSTQTQGEIYDAFRQG